MSGADKTLTMVSCGELYDTEAGDLHAQHTTGTVVLLTRCHGWQTGLVQEHS